jgi:hypothetical protein
MALKAINGQQSSAYERKYRNQWRNISVWRENKANNGESINESVAES